MIQCVPGAVHDEQRESDNGGADHSLPEALKGVRRIDGYL